MATFHKKFDSAKQEWTTPDDLFQKLHEEFNFSIDLAADINNRKCDKFFDIEQDGLLQSWKNEVGFLNPPYGSRKHKLIDWIKKAYSESSQSTSVLLIPARTNTKWFHDYCMKSAEIRFICGRPKFCNATHGLHQPLCIVIFKQHEGETKFSSFILP